MSLSYIVCEVWGEYMCSIYKLCSIFSVYIFNYESCVAEVEMIQILFSFSTHLCLVQIKWHALVYIQNTLTL